MLSDPVAEAFGLIHRHLRVKISAVYSVKEENHAAISEVLEKTLTNSVFTPKHKLS